MRSWFVRCFFAFFLISGFCSLVDEVVWLRIAMAQFGVVTPLISTVLSVFMGGLALGSWWGGRLAKRVQGHRILSSLRLYAAAELIIAASAFLVPPLLRFGRGLLLRTESDAVWGTARYHLASGAWIALVLLPFCICMGATFPLAMAALREAGGEHDRSPFGWLYAANVLGATCGTVAAPLVLVETLGFGGTLYAAAALNVVIGTGALLLSFVRATPSTDAVPSASEPATSRTSVSGGRGVLAMLFVTGLVSMAMEVVWVRQFTPYLGPEVYAFATILVLYLGATFLGSTLYRLCAGRGRPGPEGVSLGYAWIGAALCGLLPLIASDPRLPLTRHFLPLAARIGLGLGPFCAAVGFLTPMLIDRFSAGDAARAGRAYAINVTGCIVGPLLACFGLLPVMGETWSIAALAAAVFMLAPLATRHAVAGPSGVRGRARTAFIPASVGALAAGLVMVLATEDYSGLFSGAHVRRDYEATVIATVARGRKELLVNGVGITSLVPVTKMMVHLPMAFLADPPKRALVICFGMGTTFRSALSWGVPTTAADLVPSVPQLFGFYHADGPVLMQSPLARVVVDDGRRFLERTPEQFDIITIDPPPPVEAAGSSLLYSREFYGVARQRLRPGGILAQWIPGGSERAIVASVARAITVSFPNVRVFRAVEGLGLHFLASDRPIPDTSAQVLASRLPPRAAVDLVEWSPGMQPLQIFETLLSQEMRPERIVALAPEAPVLTDDRPFNEYFLMRRLLAPRSGS